MKFKRDMSPRVAIAKWIYQVRGNRPESVRDGLFSDPAWDILLDTYVQNAAEKPVSVTSACIASRVPPTTALRWITILEEDGWLVRVEDSSDKRRSFIVLSASGKSKLDKHLDDILDGVSKFSATDDYEPDTESIKKLHANIERLLAVLGEHAVSNADTGSKSIFRFEGAKALKAAKSETDSLSQLSGDGERGPSDG